MNVWLRKQRQPNETTWLLPVLLCLLGACADAEISTGMDIGGGTYSEADTVRYKLPKVLREISGLTLDDDGHLYGHDDERGIVYRIDYRAGRVVSRFALEGDVREDFEGIAWLDGHLYLTTSSGRIYRTRPGSEDALMPFEAYDGELDCEVESLTRDPTGERLLAACKNRPGGARALHVYAWLPADGRWSEAPVIRLKRSALKDVLAGIGLDVPNRVQPTAMTITPSGNLLLIAGPQKVLLELTPDGEPVAAARLNSDAHRQPEGIAMTATGTLIIADEGDDRGANKSRGRLAIYEREG